MVNKNTPAKPINNNQKISKVVTQQIFQWSAPLPPSGELNNIDKVVPGAASLIIDQYKKQSEHRRFMEKKLLKAEIAEIRNEISEQKDGRKSGLFVFSIVSVLIFFCVLKGAIIVAVILAGAIITLTGIFALGKKFFDSVKKPEKLPKKSKK